MLRTPPSNTKRRLLARVCLSLSYLTFNQGLSGMRKATLAFHAASVKLVRLVLATGANRLLSDGE